MNHRYIYRILLLNISITGIYASGFAQAPMSLYYLETIPQSNLANPAMTPRANAFVSLPSVNFRYQSDVAFNDLIQKVGDNEWVTPTSSRFDYTKLYNAIGQSLNMNVYSDVSLFGLGFRSKRDYFTFSATEKMVIQSGLPSDLFKIGDIGLVDGELYDFSTMRIKAMSYMEISFGYSREVTSDLTVGVHIKPLFGQVVAMTDISKLSMNVGLQQYDMAVSTDIYTSLPITVYSQPNQFPDSVEVKDLDASDAKNYMSSFKNPGLAVDLGAVYKFNSRLSFSAAINNLGFIRWKEDVNTIHTSGAYTYTGPNVTAENKDSLDQAFSDIADELKDQLEHNVSTDKFSTGLMPMVYLGANYKVNHALSAGFLSRTVFQKTNLRQEFNLSANYNPYKFITLNTSVNTRIKGGTYLGMAIAWYMGPVQVYIAADHIPLHYSNIIDSGNKYPVPTRMKDFNIMTGLNLVFGSKGFRDKPMLSHN